MKNFHDLTPEEQGLIRAFRVFAEMPYMGGKLSREPFKSMDEVIAALETLRDTLRHSAQEEQKHYDELIQLRNQRKAIREFLGT
jgi:hypothetical protein